MPCAPCVVHWHLRKCAGTAVRNAFTATIGDGRKRRYARYYEAHGDYRSYSRLVRRKLSSECCAVRRFTVLREPYERLLSEMDYFPGDFEPRRKLRLARRHAVWRTPWYELLENADVCSHDGLMGLCDGRRQPGHCNVTRVLAVLRDEFDHVGFVDRMQTTYELLARWAREGAAEGSDVHARQLQRAGRASTADYIARNGARNASQMIQRCYEILSDLPPPGSAPARRRPPRQGTPQHLALLQHLPSRAEFDVHNRCSNELYAAARRVFATS